MSIDLLPRAESATPVARRKRSSRIVYAVAFDLVTSVLKEQGVYPIAYQRVRDFMESRGFSHSQGSVYMGNVETVDATVTIIAVEDLAAMYDWFGPAVRDIRMFLIQDNNDLMPFVERSSRVPIIRKAPPAEQMELVFYEDLPAI